MVVVVAMIMMVVIVTVVMAVIVLVVMIVSMLVIMSVIVTLGMLVIMPVVVTMMVVTVVMVMMIMGMSRRGLISPAFRLKWRVYGDDLRTGAGQPLLDDSVALQPQLAFENLHRHVAVAEVPGKPRKRRQIGSTHFDQRLGLGHDLDQPAVVKHQRVIGPQPHHFRQVKFDAGAFDAEKETLLRLPLCVGQDHRVHHGRIAPFGGRQNTDCAGHEPQSTDVRSIGAS